MAKKPKIKVVKRLRFSATASDELLIERLKKHEGVISEAKAVAMVFAKGKNYYEKQLGSK